MDGSVVVSVLGGVVVGAWIARRAWLAWQGRRRFIRVLATVVGHRQRFVRLDENPNYWQLLTVFEFQTSDEWNRRAECPADYTTDRGSYPRFYSGERVWIRCDPQSPDRIRLDRADRSLAGSVASGILSTWLWRELFDRPPTVTPDQLLSHLATASASTPYVITVRENRFGRIEFTIELDLDNEQWRSVFERYPFPHTFLIRARVHPLPGRIDATVQLPDSPPPVDRVGATPQNRLEQDFLRAGRIAEFGERPDHVHSFSAIEALGWLWREAHTVGFEPSVAHGQRVGDTLGVLAGVIAGTGLAIWGLVELIQWL